MMGCLNKAKAVAGGKLTDQEIMDAFEQEQKIRQAFIDAGKTDNLDERVAGMIVKQALAKKIEAAGLARQAAQNIIVRVKLDNQLKIFRDAGLSLKKSFRALAEGTQKGVKGARESAYAQGQAYEAKWLGSLFSGIQKEQPHIIKRLRDKSFDDALTREMYELREGGKPGVTNDPDAKWLASHVAAVAEASRTELNKLGAAIGKLDGYAGPQVHDDMAMLKAGKDKWVNDTIGLLDIGRTFEGVTNETEAKAALSDVFDTIITGISRQSSPALKGQRIGPANLAGSLGKNRVLHFRDADAAIAYRDMYGNGSTFTGIMKQLKRHAAMAGAFDKFGPNPKAMILAMAERARKDMRDAIANAPNEKARAKLQKQADELKIEDGNIAKLAATIDDMTGISHTPVPGSAAAINANIRSGLAMSKLGGAVITAMPTDTVTMANAAMMRGQGFWNGIFGTLHELAAGPDGKQIGYLLGEGFDGLVGHMSSAFSANDGASGAVSKMADRFYRYSGLTKWTDAARSVSARVISAHLGMNAGKSFDKLSKALAHVLELNGITPEKWELIRSTAAKEVNGRTYLTPDAIRDLPDERIATLMADKLAAAKNAERRAAIIADARRDLELDLHRYIADETSYGVIETDAASRRIAAGPYRPGTYAGEAIRYFMQFKGFPVAFTQRVLGRMVNNPQMGLGNRAMNLGVLMTGLTTAGYMAMTMKDLSRGLWPPRPLSQKTLLAALVQGGALGIYGDFLFAEKSRFGNSLVGTMGGPAVSDAESLYQIYQDAKEAALYGQARAGHVAATESLNFTIQNTPFANLFYTRAALDMLFINSLRETLNPGTLRRQERNLKRDRGQSFALPRTLSEAIR